MSDNSKLILSKIVSSLQDKKAENLIALDLRGISTMTDFLVVAEGTVDRHVKALAQNVEEDLKKDQITPMYVEGLQSSDWVVLDYGDMLIHVMTHELREKYALEQLWKEGKIIDTKSL